MYIGTGAVCPLKLCKAYLLKIGSQGIFVVNVDNFVIDRAYQILPCAAEDTFIHVCAKQPRARLKMFCPKDFSGFVS